jgi:flagellar biosynthesis protein FlhG
MAKVITIASGKGGVGKTSISLNLSLALAAAGYRVCLFDADLGLANVNILTGLFPEHGLEEVLCGDRSLGDIMIKNFQGIDIIPGSSGVEKMADLAPEESKRLINSFLGLSSYDYFILDTSAGISSQVLSFCLASHLMILVATPEPTSITDAYSLLKVLSRNKRFPRVKVVINQVKTAVSAKNAYARLKETVHKFLPIKIAPLGIVAQDKKVSISVISQIPFFMLFPETDASRCIRSIALKLIKDQDPKADMPMELFWDQCLEFLSDQKQTRHSTRAGAGKTTIGERPAKNQSDKDQPLKGQALESTIQKGREESKDQAELQDRLSLIENKISLLLDEVGEIKQLLQHTNPSPETEKAPAPQKPEPIAPKLIPLDFEFWMKQQMF